MTSQDFEEVFLPKVHGAWNLHQATQTIPLDFFIMLSSAASLLGSAGQANYAAANAAIDALAVQRRSLGLPGVSVQFGPWDFAGMGSKAGMTMGHRIGFCDMELALHVLSDVILPLSDRVVPANLAYVALKWPSFLRAFGENVPNVFSRFSHLKQSTASSALPSKYRDIPKHDLQGHMLDLISDSLLEVVHLEHSDKKSLSSTPFMELGIDLLGFSNLSRCQSK
jgi:hypothetical protein